MENQEEKETSLDYLLKSLDAIMLIPMNNWHTTSEIIKKVRRKYENEIKESFEKGYEEGVKYTDGLISDERFPF
jgi:hypothetical protein